jgi:ArsR family metal-binding transcriptional regulator
MNPNRMIKPGYAYELVNIECMPSSDLFNIVMEVEASLEPLLPYLAASLPGCTYTHGTGVLQFMEEGHIVAVRPTTITITGVTGAVEADTLCTRLFRRIADVAARKEAITPVFKAQPSLTVLEIFLALPRTNCGLCGIPTCMAFAAGLHRRQEAPASCPPLRAEREKYDTLLQKLQIHGCSL